MMNATREISSATNSIFYTNDPISALTIALHMVQWHLFSSHFSNPKCTVMIHVPTIPTSRLLIKFAVHNKINGIFKAFYNFHMYYLK